MHQGLENGIAFVSSLGVASVDTCLSIILPQEAHFCDMPVRQISKKKKFDDCKQLLHAKLPIGT